MVTDKQPFRILALDGGGIKGVFTAAFLSEIERMTGKRVADYFDLITGTSTGGIIAIGLGLGLPAEQVLSFYLKHGPARRAPSRGRTSPSPPEWSRWPPNRAAMNGRPPRNCGSPE